MHGGKVRGKLSKSGPGVYTYRNVGKFGTKFDIGETFNPERRRQEHNARCRMTRKGKNATQSYIYENLQCQDYDVPLEGDRVKIGQVKRVSVKPRDTDRTLRTRLKEREKAEAKALFSHYHWPYHTVKDVKRHLINRHTAFMF